MNGSTCIANRIVGALMFLVACDCGSRKASSDAPEPIPECEEYGRALTACLHRDIGFATQAAALPKSDSERARIRTVCKENLRHLPTGCR
jgi:hypothetical protein